MRQKLRRKVRHLPKREWATEKAGAAIKESPACNVDAGRVAEVRERKYRLNVPGVPHRTDAEIAKAAVEALSSEAFGPHDRIEVKVRNGRLTLLGEVDWPYQRDGIEFAIQGLDGVRIVDNQITTSRQLLTLDEVEANIEKEIHRRADVASLTMAIERLRVLSSNGTPKATPHAGSFCGSRSVERLWKDFREGEGLNGREE